MRLTVLVPSDDYKTYAGSRIRYGRVGPELSLCGVQLGLEEIGGFDPSKAVCDAVLVSKCHDAQSLVAAAGTRERGALVGVDLFDDYFSDATDSRLLRYRNWLSQLLAFCDFAVCSTDAMVDVVRRLTNRLPVHLMNDPAPAVDERLLSAVLAQKYSKACNDRTLRVCWFGVGDNAYFPVGLSDLSAFSGELGALRRSDMDVRLTILTNRRALTADGLALIERLPVPTRVHQWSEAAECRILEESLLAFLPVSHQPFSRAKSLNRAITALTSGCQVLSSGYPLYGALDGFIYRTSKSFLEDLAAETLRLSPRSVGQFLKAGLDVWANAAIEASRLATFLKGLTPSDDRPQGMVSLIHGFGSRAETHAMVKRVNGLSVASPYCAAPLEFDVIFRGGVPNAQMLVSRQAAERLLPHARRYLKDREKIGGREFLRVEDGASRAATALGSASDTIPLMLATYESTMRDIEDRIVRAFGPSRTILSETSQLPVSAPARAS